MDPTKSGAYRTRPLVADIARTPEEVLEAWQLVYSVYRTQGLIPENPFGLHTTPAAVWRDTIVVTARRAQELVHTLSVIPDGPGGLPADHVFPLEMARFRRSSKRIAEVGLHAHRIIDQGRTMQDVILVLVVVVSYWAATQVDGVIVVSGKHASAYERLLGFRRVSNEIACKHVQGAPGVLMVARWHEAAEYFHRRMKMAVLRPDFFQHRVRLDGDWVAASMLEQLLEYNVPGATPETSVRRRGEANCSEWGNDPFSAVS